LAASRAAGPDPVLVEAELLLLPLLLDEVLLDEVLLDEVLLDEVLLDAPPLDEVLFELLPPLDDELLLDEATVSGAAAALATAVLAGSAPPPQPTSARQAIESAVSHGVADRDVSIGVQPNFVLCGTDFVAVPLDPGNASPSGDVP